MKLAWRTVRKSPALAVIGMLGIALGIAVGVGSVVMIANLFAPKLGLPDGDRIVALENWDIEANRPEPHSLHDFVTWRDEMRSVQPLAAASLGRQDLVSGVGIPQSFPAAAMTATGFQIAGVPPLLGRYLLPADESENAPGVAVIGYDLWQRIFAGARDVIGRLVLVNGVAHTIVGVMPPGFAFPKNQWLWTPLRASPSRNARGAGPALFVFGRLAPNATRKQAQAELTAIGRRAAEAFPQTNARLRPHVVPYTYPLGGARGVTLVDMVELEFMTSLLLVAIAVNVSMLVYARIAIRQGEIAIRTALGATRGRIVGQLFLEALLLSLPGAALGLAVAHAGLREIGSTFQPLPPFWMDWGLQARSVAVALTGAILTAVIVGIVPALKATGRGFNVSLQLSKSGGGPRLGRTWTALIIAQVAVVVAVLPTAVYLGYSLVRNEAVTPTFPAHEFITAIVGLAIPVEPDMDGAAYWQASEARFAIALPELERGLRADPAVVGTTLQIKNGSRLVQAESAQGADSPRVAIVNSRTVANNYFDLFGARLLAGRPFELSDAVPGGGVIVNEAFVRNVLGGGQGLGTRVRFVTSFKPADEQAAGPWREIVGVVGNLYAKPLDPESAPAAVYAALDRGQLREVSLVVRTRGDNANGFIPRLQQIATARSSDIRIGRVLNLGVMPNARYIVALVTALAIAMATVVLLSAMGINALMSLTVTRRQKELGIRIALGARPDRLLGSIFSRAGWQLGLGALIGSLVGGTLLRANDASIAVAASILGGVVALVLVAGLVAAVGPARRAVLTEPMNTLRND
jgi:predicted permease